jgi:hypothetical protein
VFSLVSESANLVEFIIIYLKVVGINGNYLGVENMLIPHVVTKPHSAKFRNYLDLIFLQKTQEVSTHASSLRDGYVWGGVPSVLFSVAVQIEK